MSQQPHAWTDDEGRVHYSLDHARGGALGPASWTSDNDVNPICGCHLASRCLNCRCCTNCEGCYCGEE
jgi:hypothetical protein